MHNMIGGLFRQTNNAAEPRICALGPFGRCQLAGDIGVTPSIYPVRVWPEGFQRPRLRGQLANVLPRCVENLWLNPY